MQNPALRRVCALAGLSMLAACATAEPAKDFAPRAHVPPTPLPAPDFAAYVEASRAHIEAYGVVTVGPLPADLVRDRAPFELAPAVDCPQQPRRGVLLIHDLGGTPFEMRDLGERLQQACFQVRAILLPGHGTTPEDLDGVAGERWLEAAALGRSSFAGEADSLAVVGFGLGSTLALLGSADADGPPLDALVLIAPRLTSPGVHFRLDALFRTNGRAPDGAAGLPNPVRYTTLPASARTAAKELADAAAEAGLANDLPVFLVGSADDGIADPEAAWVWFCQDLRGPRRLVWYAKGNVKPGACAFVAARASDGFPEVLGFSHVGLPVAPGNPRLGVAAASPFACNHYGLEQSREWLLCADPAKAATNGIRYGAVIDAETADGIVRTLGWNPDFDQMADDIIAFLGQPGAR